MKNLSDYIKETSINEAQEAKSVPEITDIMKTCFEDFKTVVDKCLENPSDSKKVFNALFNGYDNLWEKMEFIIRSGSTLLDKYENDDKEDAEKHLVMFNDYVEKFYKCYNKAK